MKLDQYEIPQFDADDIANEGLITFFKDLFGIGSIAKEELDSWESKIVEPLNLLGKKNGYPTGVIASQYITLSKVYVDNKRGIISIQNVNGREILRRIRETYGEKRLDNIFDRTYDNNSIKKYKKKRISKGGMKITSLYAPTFFALELSLIFKDLYAKYKTPAYSKIAKEIYKQTWLSKSDNTVPEKINLSRLSTINPEYELQPHQLEFLKLYPKLKAQLNLRGYYLAFDQGLGKTLTASALAECLEVDKVYIVCPNTLMAVWLSELRTYFEGKYGIYICDKKGSPDKNTKFFIVNNESIKNIYPYLDKSAKTMMILDEGHNFRNIDGQRSQDLLYMREVLEPNDVLMMSGTPLKASPNEMVPALALLDPIFTPDAARIYNRCFKYDSYMAMSIVTERFGKLIYRKTKDEVLQLPQKTIEDLRLTVPNQSQYYMSTIREEVQDWYAKIYPQVIKGNESIRIEFETLVRKYSTARVASTNWYLRRILRISDDKESDTIGDYHELDQEQIRTFLATCVLSNTKIPAGIKKKLPEMESKLLFFDRSAMGQALGKVYPPKRNALFSELYMSNRDKFIEMIEENEKKTVIFSQFLPVVNFIHEDLNKAGIKTVKIIGGVSSSSRADIISQFKYDESIRVIIATSQTMGTGVTLTEASQMFFFGPPWRSTDYDQCCDRIYRIGQDVDVFIYNILLDSDEINLSDRMDKILKWSNEMFHSAIDQDEIATESYSLYDKFKI